MLEHISMGLICDVDRQVGEAIGRVEDRECLEASVSITFKASRDKDGDLTVEYAHRHTTTKKGQWSPATNPRLPFEARG